MVNWIADRLPEPVAGQVKGFLDGGDAGGADAGSGGDLMEETEDALGGLGGMLGGRD